MDGWMDGFVWSWPGFLPWDTCGTLKDVSAGQDSATAPGVTEAVGARGTCAATLRRETTSEPLRVDSDSHWPCPLCQLWPAPSSPGHLFPVLRTCSRLFLQFWEWGEEGSPSCACHVCVVRGQVPLKSLCVVALAGPRPGERHLCAVPGASVAWGFLEQKLGPS